MAWWELLVFGYMLSENAPKLTALMEVYGKALVTHTKSTGTPRCRETTTDQFKRGLSVTKLQW